MDDERLSLKELKERAALGYTKIQREGAAIVDLASWPGFSSESETGPAFSHVAVLYGLAGNQVTVFKGGKAVARYTLS